jgi:hypothetical protein
MTPGHMDVRTWEVFIAICLIVLGAIMSFNDLHNAESGHSKVSKHLAKVQGRIALAIGIMFLIHWLFW